MVGSDSKARIALIGLGNMGNALASSVLSQGYPLAIWNRTQAKADDFKDRGARIANSVAVLVAECEVLLICVIDHRATMNLLDDTLVTTGLKGKTIVQLSTVTSLESRTLSDWAAERDIQYLDAQILDYPDAIRSHRATIVCSGPQTVFDELRKLLGSIAGKVVFVGSTAGLAPAFDKAILTFTCGIYLALIQGAAMCHAAGVSLDAFFERGLSYVEGAGLRSEYSSIIKMIGARSYAEDVEASLDIWTSALGSCIDQCEAMNISSDYLKAGQAILEDSIRAGRLRENFAAVFETLVTKRI